MGGWLGGWLGGCHCIKLCGAGAGCWCHRVERAPRRSPPLLPLAPQVIAEQLAGMTAERQEAADQAQVRAKAAAVLLHSRLLLCGSSPPDYPPIQHPTASKHWPAPCCVCRWRPRGGGTRSSWRARGSRRWQVRFLRVPPLASARFKPGPVSAPAERPGLNSQLTVAPHLPAELRTAYEALAHENQRLSGSLGELTRELQARDTGAGRGAGAGAVARRRARGGPPGCRRGTLLSPEAASHSTHECPPAEPSSACPPTLLPTPGPAPQSWPPRRTRWRGCTRRSAARSPRSTCTSRTCRWVLDRLASGWLVGCWWGGGCDGSEARCCHSTGDIAELQVGGWAEALAARPAGGLAVDTVPSATTRRPSTPPPEHTHIAPQAYERQVEALQRALARGEAAAGGLDAERQGLLERLRAAEQARAEPNAGRQTRAVLRQAGRGRRPGQR